MEDKKLSTKTRSKLPASSFCGPGRSFPANDCNHVRAGISLLGRYKGKGSKTRIKSCLYKKAKSMKCFKSTKDNWDTMGIDEILKTFTSKEIEDANKLLESDEFKDSIELLDFINDIEVSEDELNNIKDSACILLDKIRMKRLNTDASNLNEYKTRPINVILDLLLMELENESKKD